MRCTGKIEDPKAHVMGLAYLSDSHLLGVTLVTSNQTFKNMAMMVSLDHSIYFHAPLKVDEWLMHCVESPWAGSERGIAIGRFFNQDGIQVATVVQEGLLRMKQDSKL